MDKRYIAKFDPQVWIRDYAVSVDAKGFTEWECTEFMNDRSFPIAHSEIDEAIEKNDYFLDRDDVFKGDPNAPEWIRNWDGPFTINVSWLED